MKIQCGLGEKQHGCAVLVVEDEILIAIDMGYMIEDAGYDVMGPALNVDQALKLVASHRPDAAVLDVNLNGEKVTAVAAKLIELQVPFLLCSANSRETNEEEVPLRGAVNIGKPANSGRLDKALRLLLTNAPAA